MVEHGGGAGLEPDLGSDPVDAVGLVHVDAGGEGECDGGLAALHPVELVGPDVGQQASALDRVGEVGGPPVAGGPLDHPDGRVQRRQRAVPVGGADHGRGRVAPGGHVAQLVAEAVPVEVEAGARAHLEAAQRQAQVVGEGEEAAEQDQRTADLVGLRLVAHEGEDVAAVVGQGADAGLPGGLRIARLVGRPREGGGDLRRLVAAGEPGEGVGNAVGHRGVEDASPVLPHPRRQELGAGPAGVHVVGDLAQEVAEERRAELAAHSAVEAQR